MPRQQKTTTYTKKNKAMTQSKEQTYTSTEIQEFKQLMLNQFKKFREDIAKEIEAVKEALDMYTAEIKSSKKQLVESMEMKGTTQEMKDTMETYNSRSQEAEENTQELENKTPESLHTKEQMEKRMKKYEQCFGELKDETKYNNVHIIGVPEGEEKGKGAEAIIEEIINENFPSLMKDIKLQIQEMQHTPNRRDMNRPMPRHLIIRLSNVKDKERILKAAREKRSITYKGSLIRLCADLSAETMEARRKWCDIFKILKEKNHQPRILYPAKLSFKYEGELKIFSDKQTMRDFVNKTPALQEILKGALQGDRRQECVVWNTILGDGSTTM